MCHNVCCQQVITKCPLISQFMHYQNAFLSGVVHVRYELNDSVSNILIPWCIHKHILKQNKNNSCVLSATCYTMENSKNGTLWRTGLFVRISCNNIFWIMLSDMSSLIWYIIGWDRFSILLANYTNIEYFCIHPVWTKRGVDTNGLWFWPQCRWHWPMWTTHFGIYM